MMLTSLVFLVAGLTLAYTALVIGIVARLYQEEELGIIAVFTGVFSIVFITAFITQEGIVDVMLTRYGLSYEVLARMTLLGSSPLRGPEIAAGEWIALYISSFDFIVVLIVIASLLGAYSATRILGLSKAKALAVLAVIGVLGAVGLALSIATTRILNPYIPMDPAEKVATGLMLRDIANTLKLVVLAASLGLLTVSYLKTYFETGERVFLAQGSSWLLMLLGWALVMVTTLSGWERIAARLVMTEQGQLMLTLYTLLSLVLLVAGSIGLLVSSIISYVAPRPAEVVEMEPTEEVSE